MSKTSIGSKASALASTAASTISDAVEKPVKAVTAKGKAVLGSEPDGFQGPSPNPRTNLAIADVALRGSAMLARRAVERGLLGSKYTPRKAKAILKGRTFGETLFHTAIARVAVQSVPGAIIVGGGLLAKTLYDRSKARQARAKGEAGLEDMANKGKK